MRADDVLDLDGEAAGERIRNHVVHGTGCCRAHDAADSILDVPTGMAVGRVIAAVIPERCDPEGGGRVSLASIGIATASTPGTVVGNGGVVSGGAGSAIAVGASGDLLSMHAVHSAIPARNHAFRIAGHRTRFARRGGFRYSDGT